MSKTSVPFFRPDLSGGEIDEVVATLKSGWLTTGPRTKRFEEEFAAAVGGRHAIALNSCTAALHLAVEALGLKAGDAVLVPTMTFAATAEVVRYLGAIPVLVDCDPVTLNLDLDDADRKLGGAPRGPAARRGVGGREAGRDHARSRRRPDARPRRAALVGEGARPLGRRGRGARIPRVVPGGSRPRRGVRCGEGTADVTCFSFYANKTITTGEGGMAVTDDPALAERMRLMSLHGLSHDAWARYSGGRAWDYRILAPGFKYNLTDVAAAIGIRPARARRGDARGARQDRAALPRGVSPRSRRSSCLPIRRTGSMPGTSFRSGCDSTGSPSTGTT